MTIKLDMKKAYDVIDNLFKNVSLILVFPTNGQIRLWNCIITTSFSALVKGITGEPFRPERGIRHRYYIFIYFFHLH